MRPVTIRARDGLALPSYLTLPREGFRAGPLLLYVHGGPYSRDSWGYSPIHQWLADRGYAVLSVNYRGSTGFGKAFVNAADGEWGRGMHDDLLDAVEWAIAAGIADRARVGIYGGYAALVGATMTPEVFACAADLVGISNLVTFMDSVPPYWSLWFAIWKRRLADPGTEEGRAWLRERSPLTHVDRIRRPLLIGHGANDMRVKVAESEQIVAAMRARGLPVTYALFPDEGHGLARPANRMAFYALLENFLARHLGGRAEPIGDALVQSSVRIAAGGELIPGAN
jgi:dipeptidyl aminopeptidase/acylaminoacyl peptidase